jgi:hypothetical protein
MNQCDSRCGSYACSLFCRQRAVRSSSQIMSVQEISADHNNAYASSTWYEALCCHMEAHDGSTRVVVCLLIRKHAEPFCSRDVSSPLILCLHVLRMKVTERDVLNTSPFWPQPISLTSAASTVLHDLPQPVHHKSPCSYEHRIGCGVCRVVRGRRERK